MAVYSQTVSSFLTRAAVAAVGVVAVFAAGGARAATSADYVQNGLVAHWDAIDNAGVGVHSSTTDRWVDLSGNNCDWSLTVANVEWTDKGLVLKGVAAAGGNARSDAPSYFSNAGIRTIEFVYANAEKRDGIIFAPGLNRTAYLYTDQKGRVGYFDLVGQTVELNATNTYSVLYTIGSGTTISGVSRCWLNGEAFSTFETMGNWWGNNMGIVWLGGRNNGTPYAKGTLFAIRLYNRELTDKERESNRLLDGIRFLGESPDLIKIEGSPLNIGSPAPDYGVTNNLVAGQNYTFTCPAVYTNDAADVAATCRGWTLALTNGAVTAGSEREKTITYDATVTRATLTWNWDVEYKVTSAPEVTVSSSWATPGSVVTLTAVPPTGKAVFKWTDTLSNKTYTGNPLKVAVNGAMNILPEYGDAHYVATDGHDDTGDGSAANPYASIDKALSVARSNDTVIVKAGPYTMTAELSVTNAVAIRGATGDPADVTLTMGTAKTRHFVLNNAGSALSGLTLKNGSGGKGGSVYINTRGGTVSKCVFDSSKVTVGWGAMGGAIFLESADALVTHCYFTNNTCETSFDGDGPVGQSGGNAAAVEYGTIRNCLFVGNGKRTAKAGQGGTVVLRNGGLIENCTFANNANTRCAGVRPYGANAVVRNCVFGGADCPNATSEEMKVMYNTDYAARFDHCASPAEINGTCIKTAAPFADAARGDWTPAAVIVDKGVYQTWMTDATDYADNPRVCGDGPDIGCYERDLSRFGASVEPHVTAGIAPCEVTFTVTTCGTVADGITCHWDWDGDGTWDDTSTGTTNHTFEAGVHSVKVKVVDNATQQEYVPEDPMALSIVPKTICVDVASPNPTFPYMDWDHAATTIADAYAVAADGCEIAVATGPYPVSSAIDVMKSVTIRSATGKPEDVVITLADKANTRHFILNNAGSVLSGLTMKNGSGGQGGSVYIGLPGGTVSNCVFDSSKVTVGWGAMGGAIFLESANALVTHCYFTNNTCETSFNDGSVGQSGGNAAAVEYGTIRNCLFVGNGKRTAKAGQGGTVVLRNGGLIENCTFANNANTHCAGVRPYGANAVVRNCVFGGADCPSAVSEEMKVMYNTDYAARFDHCASPAEINGTCIKTAAPFADAAHGDWTPAAVIVDKGVYQTWMDGATDYAGNPRIDGDRPDIGCYEKDQSQFGASVESSVTAGIAPCEVTFTVTTYGIVADGITCHWDWDGNGTWDATSTGTTNHTFEAGVHSVKVKVVDNATQQEYAPANPMALSIVPKTICVDVDSPNPTFPYMDWDHAARTIADAYAVAADGCEIAVAAGPYSVSSAIDVLKNVTIRGATGNPADVVLTMGASGTRHFVLNNAGSVLSGLTMKNGSGGKGGSVYIESQGGTVSNCVFDSSKVTVGWGAMGGAIFLESANALVTHCSFTNNTCETGFDGDGPVGQAGGNAAAVEYGTIRNCLFVGNGKRTAKAGQGGTVALRNGGLIENCTFVSNANARCAGVRPYGANAVVRNCLFYGADCPSATSELMKIMYDASYSNRFSYCCAPVLINDGGTCVVTDDPQFRNVGKGDYRLKSTSPAVDKGAKCDWMENATDLSGRPRISHKKPDIGAYECQVGGFTLIVR